MLSPLRNRFGIPGVIAVIALVFAMLGGAYAASNSGGGKATASAKAKKGPRGPKGPAGPAGPQGPAGPAGPAGPKGDAGSNGSNGADGKNGATGVTGPSGKNGTNGTNGKDGVTGPTGPTGETGATGEAGPITGILPSGVTLTGMWNIASLVPKEAIEAIIPLPTAISFGLSLAEQPLENERRVHYLNKAGEEWDDLESEYVTPSGACPGVIEDQPTAEPGQICFYAQEEKNLNHPASMQAHKSGALLAFVVFAGEEPKQFSASGLWAVTAP
jgi:hypothetical protein